MKCTCNVIFICCYFSVVVPRRRFSGYGRKKRESSPQNAENLDEEVLLVIDPVQHDEEPDHRDFGDLSRLLNIAGAKPQV